MRKINRLTLEELVEKNKEELMKDQVEMEHLKEKLNEKVEEKMFNRFKKLV